MTKDELAFLSAAELLNAYRRRDVSPIEVTETALARIDRLNPKLNAFLYVDHEGARAAARAATEAWAKPGPKPLLLGVPVSVKDLVPTRSMPTTFGSLAYNDFRAERDAPVVDRLRAAGAVLLGKTNTPEFGLLGVTRNRLGEEGRNPWSLEHTCGGSSGGAAAAVAAGLGPLAVATDGAGSVRIPASFCGVYGIKPNFGRIPTHGLTGAPHASTIGPISRTVEDAALFLQATAGPDDRDPLCLESPPPDFFASLGRRPLDGLRVAFSLDLGFAAIDPEVAVAVAQGADLLRDLGCEVVEGSPPVDNSPEAFPMSPADEYAFDTALLDEHEEELTPYAVRTFRAGKEMPAWKYSQALRKRERYIREMKRWFQDYDLFLTAATAHPACPVGGEVTRIAGREVNPGWPIWFTSLFNRSGNPAASVPMGFHSSGLPMAVQLAGRLEDEPLVLAASAALEAARPWREAWPAVAKE
jgi:aspartyl-tRNA(Asn)/glutamyl-tRNA(Gln) amidotransferase subunit A